MSVLSARSWDRVRSLLPARADYAVLARNPRRDLLAGLTVALVALPLAPGFGVSSGLGAEAGLATAVVAGALAALSGGSNLQVSGPTGAMTVVLVPIVARYGSGGVLTVGLMAGVLLVVLVLLKAGRYMRNVPAPVVEEHALLAEHLVAYRIDGPLFFAGAHRFLLELSEVADVRVVVLRMSRITTMDATGALVLKDAVEKLNRRGIAVMTSGIRPGRRQTLDSVGASGLLQREGRAYASTPQAIAGARAHLQRTGLIKGPGGTGWTVTVTGPAEVVTDTDEAAHYRRTLPGRTYGPHDTLVRIRPQAVDGFRLLSPETM
ncbi:SulP family inorganic anion transporter [Streptomyces sp. NPDC057963]|uniref:SulP family inorganic anion transporter n=1 Tax=Streptomyces sp. NPDC057963 TaxID=3346290 RepID=UPI0036E90D0A